jgi:hypothetical protein
MKDFKEYLDKGVVKKVSPNKSRAAALVIEVEEKKRFLDFTLLNLPKDKMSTNFIADYCYDIIMELIRAKMFLEGYNPGNSHEAEISYMRKLDFTEYEMAFMDELRYNRNGIKYYGAIIDKDYANKILNFMEK